MGCGAATVGCDRDKGLGVSVDVQLFAFLFQQVGRLVYRSNYSQVQASIETSAVFLHALSP